ncbi:S24 family peptidase [Photobacterium damselae]|uniref:S24 family peptidase n=1 Tax=Photobacterium damselae TaxID=38293 RepID=UPI001FD86EF1|nr:S24 family peptidase [Photobacterium damselae]
MDIYFIIICMKEISSRIKAQRKELKLSQKKLANLVGVTTSAISQWEREETTPKGENLLNLASALSCSAEWLVGKKQQITVCEYIEIPFFDDIKASAGFGCICGQEDSYSISLPKKIFRYYNIDDLVAITSHGNSMEPVLSSESLLVIDTNVERINDGSMYVVRQDDLIRVKLISIGIKGLVLQSYNKNYPDEVYEKYDDIEILGKVIWYSSRCF